MMQMFMYRRNNNNNGISYSENGMPQKDSTSDGNSSFALGRQNYTEIANATNSMTQAQKTAKKWYGNRDASSVTDKRRNITIGKGTVNNAGNAIGFTTNIDRNTAREAILRARSRGNVVPPQCVNRPGTSGAVCFTGGHSNVRFNAITSNATKINQNSDRTKDLLLKRSNLGCTVPYDCINQPTFCKTQC